MAQKEEDQRAILADQDQESESDTESDVDGSESEPDNSAAGGAKPPQITPDSSSSVVQANPNPNFPDSSNPNPNSGQNERRALPPDDSRRLFQRLWTDEEELIILRGFLDFTSKRGTTFASHQYDTGPFYEEIKQRLQLDFSKNQLIEKLRRLKKKYRNCAGRMKAKGKNFSFRSPHEQSVFEIARHIWRPANKHGSLSADDDDVSNDVTMTSAPNKRNPRSRRRNARKFQPDQTTRVTTETVPAVTGLTVPVQEPVREPVVTERVNLVPVREPEPVPVASSAANGLVEETVRSYLTPLFRELIGAGTGTGTGPVGMPGLGPVPVCPAGKISDEKWRQQYVLELEVYLRRIELVKEQVVFALQELQGNKS